MENNMSSLFVLVLVLVFASFNLNSGGVGGSGSTYCDVLHKWLKM